MALCMHVYQTYLIHYVSYVFGIHVYNYDSISISNIDDIYKIYIIKGFDPTLVGKDVLYYHNVKSNSYEVLDQYIFNDMMSGKMRF